MCSIYGLLGMCSKRRYPTPAPEVAAVTNDRSLLRACIVKAKRLSRSVPTCPNALAKVSFGDAPEPSEHRLRTRIQTCLRAKQCRHSFGCHLGHPGVLPDLQTNGWGEASTPQGVFTSARLSSELKVESAFMKVCNLFLRRLCCWDLHFQVDRGL